jgi:phosphatidylserine/phosphatidylglycerophosphate/cardiolipin synthase-like enzyme
MIIDAETVITGSFNFTKAAEESNAENLLIIRNKRLASLYTKNWKEHADHSERKGMNKLEISISDRSCSIRGSRCI